MYELETTEGELLTFATQEELYEYVISRMVETQQLTVAGRTEDGDLNFQARS